MHLLCCSIAFGMYAILALFLAKLISHLDLNFHHELKYAANSCISPTTKNAAGMEMRMKPANVIMLFNQFYPLNCEFQVKNVKKNEMERMNS